MDFSFLTDGGNKVIKFCMIGALGCLAGAMLGEIPFRLLLPPPQAEPQVDVMFVLDVTSSMGDEISGIRDGIIDFSQALSDKGLDSRIGLLAFGDHFEGEQSRLLFVDGSPFTKDHREFQRQVGELTPSGGGDAEESSFEALVEASQQPFREGAEKVLLLITDAPPHNPVAHPTTTSMSQVIASLRVNDVNWLHLVVPPTCQSSYEGLQNLANGDVFHLGADRQNFDQVLTRIGKQISEDIAGLSTSTKYAGESLPRLTLATAVWTAFLAIGVSLALIAGQNVFLHRPLLNVSEGKIGVGGAALAGLIGGGVGQLLRAKLLSSFWLLMGWALLGALVGRGMAFFVPNLNPRRVLAFGAVGGALGAVGYLLASFLGEAAGRFVGAAILGFFIGLAVALVETAFRVFWLQVCYGEKEFVDVSLGEQPVRIGGDARLCTVFAIGARPIVCEYKLQDGRILCTDAEGEKTREVQPGDARKVGNLTVTVCASQHAGPKAVAPPPPPPAKRSESESPKPTDTNKTPVAADPGDKGERRRDTSATKRDENRGTKASSAPPPPPPPPSKSR